MQPQKSTATHKRGNSHPHHKVYSQHGSIAEASGFGHFATEDLGIHSEDSSIMIDAKCMIGIFRLISASPL